MSIIEELKDGRVWNDYLQDRRLSNQLARGELEELASFVAEKRYEDVDLDSFGYPRKIVIAKLGSKKKRTVYSYSRDETAVLSLLAWLLRRYDHLLTDNCYSFRSTRTPRKAFDIIGRMPRLEERYVLKADIHDYFNSIDVDLLMEILKDLITDDDEVIAFMEGLLRQDRCMVDGELIEEKRGAMAGVPLANFFANVYLLSLDEEFQERGNSYFRYSDDILIFFDSREELDAGFELLKKRIEDKHLSFNPDKLMIAGPHEEWEFLGFSYRDGQFDLSKGAIEKLKGKIRRKAKKIWRWRKRRGIGYEKAARTMIRNFDSRFYDLRGRGGFSWSRFYFPILTSDKGLKEIDGYMLMYLRYLYSGKHCKGNYRIAYEDLKRLGYTPLLAEYYNWKKENRELLESRSRHEE